MLEINRCCLVIVDIQGKLAQLMHDKEALFKNVRILIQGAKILEIPILWCQQVPMVLGATVPEIAELLTEYEPINKATFSCCLHEPFADALKKLKRSQVLLCGIETHICIYQTAMDLLARNCEKDSMGNKLPILPDYEVTVIADAVSSRAFENKHIALGRLQSESVKISSTEMALFELLKTAEHEQFRQIAKLVK
jgi:nicotinamidase-related amidase